MKTDRFTRAARKRVRRVVLARRGANGVTSSREQVAEVRGGGEAQEGRFDHGQGRRVCKKYTKKK